MCSVPNLVRYGINIQYIYRNMVREMMVMKGREQELGAKGPSDKWFRGFYERHPTLTEKKETRRDHGRLKQTNEAVMNHWFRLLGKFLIKIYLCIIFKISVRITMSIHI